jgi:F-type H+-transporting ATPase subunit delta
VKNTILAKRYAKALFAVGNEEDAIEEYAQSLGQLAALFAEVPEVVDGLTNPLYPLEVRVKVSQDIMQAAKGSPIMTRFLTLLVEKKRAAALPDIAEAFQGLVDADNNISRGTVVSAIELSPELKGKVESTLNKLTGKQVTLTAEVDASIIGGIIAKVGDLVLDGSLKSQLNGLKESIQGSV